MRLKNWHRYLHRLPVTRESGAVLPPTSVTSDKCSKTLEELAKGKCHTKISTFVTSDKIMNDYQEFLR